jgi:hypothetical protein
MEIGGLVLGAVGNAVLVMTIVDDAFAFSSECLELQARCRAVESILKANDPSVQQLPGMAELSERLDKCGKYLKSCKERKFIRNPIFEVTFHRRIDKYNTRLDRWMISATLSLMVCAGQNPAHDSRAKNVVVRRRGWAFIPEVSFP